MTKGRNNTVSVSIISVGAACVSNNVKEKKNKTNADDTGRDTNMKKQGKNTQGKLMRRHVHANPDLFEIAH